ncbi:MAG: class I poly(R)-hydroxyalkanoic acid synthase [Alphaproteobacteria bacterium]|nr:class I poly(R)-hydroxyalkanoic acid synthase [Alphaproteobacteria bacterium]
MTSEKIPANNPAGAPLTMTPPDFVAFSQRLYDIALRSQKMLNLYLEKNRWMASKMGSADPAGLGQAYAALAGRIFSNPKHLIETQLAFWQDYIKLLRATAAASAGRKMDVVIEPSSKDKRFKDPAWQDMWIFDFFKQSYLLVSNWTQEILKEAVHLDPQMAHKVTFWTNQIIDAISPTNFMLSNPEAWRATIETKGENLLRGFENMLKDMERGQGTLLVSMSDSRPFKFGENIATTKGKVVFQNELIQLIQFSPLTEKVHKTPVLIIPPWINKYYILDLKPEASYIRHIVEQGHTVYIISWVNPDARHAHLGFDDYMTLGPVRAAMEIKKITGEDTLNTIGYCIGGTLLACMLGWMAGLGDHVPAEMPKINSATYLVTLVDFTDIGDIAVFVDENQIKMIENMMKDRGFLPAPFLASTFAMLRANDLIWQYVVNNYLMGKDPFPFDLLSWNADSTNLPAAMQSYYLRNMYKDNKLVQPGALSMKGVPIDVRQIKVPSFILSTIEDHITPWRTTYAATQLYTGPRTFCLSGSGHIAGVVNPPAKKKYNYWISESNDYPANPDQWLEKATKHDGSWWPAWFQWLAQYSGDMTAPRDPAANPNATEDAPGSYVRVRVIG